MRGRDDIGSTLIDVLVRYAASLHAVESRLMLTSVGDRVREQLDATGTMQLIGEQNIYAAGDYLGESTKQAYDDGRTGVAGNQPSGE